MSKSVRLIRNISYSVIANLVSFLVGVTVVLLVPQLVGVEEYGYFQLFLFFISYVGFFHFGWADGVILRYAGEHWERLNRPRFASFLKSVFGDCFVSPVGFAGRKAVACTFY